MIDPNLKLTVFHDDDSSFVNYTDDMCDYLSNPSTIEMTTADYLYFGYKKPFNSVYFDFNTPNTTVDSLLVEYYDGSSWVTAVFSDDTNAFQRSGLVTWDKANMESVEINSVSKYYVRISVGADSSAMVFNGGNIVFADDRDLKQEFYEITNSGFLPQGFASHIPSHVAARNQIMQELRNRGNQTTNSVTGVDTDVNPYDLHNIFQIKQAATFLALSKIFFILSDNMEDQWFMRFEEYRNKYKEAMSLYNLDVDTNNNGVSDNTEKDNKYKVFRFSR